MNPYATLAADAVGGLSPYQPGMPPEELEREYGIKNAIKLASNENPAAVPVSVSDAMQTALQSAAGAWTAAPSASGSKLFYWTLMANPLWTRMVIHRSPRSVSTPI